MEPSTALAPMTHADTAIDAPLPVFSGPQMAKAFEAYRELQNALDRAMPDQLQRIGDRTFRKKGFWRGVSLAFNLTVEPIEERREVIGTFDDGRDNFAYLVTYRASAPNGRSQTGDGACAAVEKAEAFRCPHPQHGNPNRSEHYPHNRCPDFDPEFQWRALPAQATEHNVRAHAHTRAYNRAVSNLCGFGEVSAEEVEHVDDDGTPGPARTTRPAATGSAPRSGGGGGRTPYPISEPQARRLWTIARNRGWTEDEVRTRAKAHGFEHVHEITKDKYDAIVAEIEQGLDGVRP